MRVYDTSSLDNLGLRAIAHTIILIFSLLSATGLYDAAGPHSAILELSMFGEMPFRKAGADILVRFTLVS